ncbi:MAG: type II toxin-antitoxin system RelE/ParE family toxin [Thermoguttaceae bacterium]
MSLILDVFEQAKRDAELIGDYIADRNSSAAIRFALAIPKTFELLCQMPKIGDRVPKHPGIRMRRVVGFGNYLVFYRLVDNTLQVLRILHGARNVADLLTEPK